jgi:UDPglucose 6-dehydrogenase
MKITVHGSGYVGLVSAACFANMGNDVMCVDVDRTRIARLKQGEVPIVEPGLDQLLVSGLESGRLKFTDVPAEGVHFGLLQFIAVGTPPDEDGSADLKYVLQVAQTIGEHMTSERIVVDKSTVPVGTADKVRETMAAALRRRGAEIAFDVVSNPEFLKEGSAIEDFAHPDRIVVGAESARSIEVMRSLYAPFTRNHERLMVMAVRDAEFTKYAANSMLAARISMMNEFANIAERLGVDIEQVRKGIGSDSRIGYPFLYPGVGYGGSCFPKDVQALLRTAVKSGYTPVMLNAVEEVNRHQKTTLFEKIRTHFDGKLKGRTIALWGLAFKPNTDDMREAPSRVLMEALWAEGVSVRAYDPAAMHEADRLYNGQPLLSLCESDMECLDGADALVVVTEWTQFRSPDFDEIRSRLKQPVIFDGRNVYSPQDMRANGFTHYSVGRPSGTLNSKP